MIKEILFKCVNQRCKRRELDLEIRIGVHGIDSLQTEPGALVEEKIYEHGPKEIATRENEAVAILNVARNERREECDQEALYDEQYNSKEVIINVSLHNDEAGTYFHIQLDAVASAACLARVRIGKVSPVRIQIPGAHVEA